jgi:hypothetical protein
VSDLGVNFKALREAVDWSSRQLETPRKKRLEAIRQYVGSHYSDFGSDKRVPTNFLELAVLIYSRQLAARAPRVIVTAKNRELRPHAKTMEIALNQIPDEIDLGDTLHRAVVEALFSYAVVKVGITPSSLSVLGHNYGEPFADIVSIDNYFLDMSAKTRKAIQFEGDDYWLPVEDARKLFNKQAIEPDKHANISDQGSEQAQSVSVEDSGSVYKDRVYLRDVYLPRENKVVTYGVISKEMYAVVDWDGPEHSPYHYLGFSDVPGNLLPLPPVSLWRDLHELGNNLFRRLGRQAEGKKSVAAFAGGNEESVEALKKAQDGDGIRYNGSKPETITVGGIDAPTLAFYLQLRDLFSYFAGNLDMLGGLSPMSDTVGQDKLLSEAANTRMKFMADKTMDFAKGIFKALAWYEWTDPVRVRQVTKTVKGTDLSVTRKWSAETREGDFLDYNFNIDVFSMQDDSPSTKLQKIGSSLERFIFPVMDGVMQQGGQIDFKRLVEIISDLGNVPELNDIVVFAEPPNEPAVVGNSNPGGGAAKPAHTTRTYERVNRPGATRAGKDDVMSRLLMGGKVQGAEAAALGRGNT